VAFSVPTGNFGDVYAGYAASKMGLPVAGLIVATNRNDILSRFMASGSYKIGEVFPTLAPSMDIQVSSNFERLLFDALGEDAAALRGMMAEFSASGVMTPPQSVWRGIRRIFSGRKVEEGDMLKTIKDIYATTADVLDPHTAIGVAAAYDAALPPEVPIVCLATASPAKFPDAVHKACAVVPELPAHMADLLQRQEKYTVVPNDIAAIKCEIEKL
jgi:threonine synthase